MRAPARRLLLATATALLILPVAIAGAVPGQAAPDTTHDTTPIAATSAACGPAATIARTLPGGTTWRMCWHNSPTAGLVLESVSYQPRHAGKPVQVLASARLAQINVPYDNGKYDWNDVTGEQLGDLALPLAPKDCPGGTIKSFLVTGDEDRPHPVRGLCVTTQPRGFAYHGDSGDVGEEDGRTDSAQGTDLVLYTVNYAGWYHYITQWNFSDDGTITAKEGATGNLSPGDFDADDGHGWPLGKGARARAVSHQHNVFWRLNFHLDGSSRATVEQYDTRRDGTRPDGYPRLKTTRRHVTKELAGDAANTRWWRVVSAVGKNEDGHRRSWEIVQEHTDKYAPHPYTRHDVYFTEYSKCEGYASDNDIDNESPCANTVDRFVNGQTLSHPVVWVNVGFHHIARDEDQTPMPVHWQGFQIVPRDVTAMSPLTPDRLHQPRYNGETGY